MKSNKEGSNSLPYLIVTVQYPVTHMGTDTLVSASRQQGISPQVLRPE